jgi:hypothetical protein
LSSLSSSLSLSSLFSELVVSPLLEQAHRAGSSSEETSSSDEEEESSSSSLNARRFFDVVVESSFSSSAYLRLFSEDDIGVTVE